MTAGCGLPRPSVGGVDSGWCERGLSWSPFSPGPFFIRLGLGKDGLPKAWGQILPCQVGLNKPLNLREPGFPYL